MRKTRKLIVGAGLLMATFYGVGATISAPKQPVVSISSPSSSPIVLGAQTANVSESSPSSLPSPFQTQTPSSTKVVTLTVVTPSPRSFSSSTPTTSFPSVATPITTPVPVNTSQKVISTPVTVVAPISDSTFYANCTAAWNANAAPVYRGQAGYRSALDRDNDGIGCEYDPR